MELRIAMSSHSLAEALLYFSAWHVAPGGMILKEDDAFTCNDSPVATRILEIMYTVSSKSSEAVFGTISTICNSWPLDVTVGIRAVQSSELIHRKSIYVIYFIHTSDDGYSI
eukprot:6112163-Pleurochrysis_carterae.AAC.1